MQEATPAPALGPEVQALLSDHLETYEQLEILLRLSRAPGETWSVSRIDEELRIQPELATAALEKLCRSRLLGVRGNGFDALYRYAPGEIALAAAVEALAHAYEEHRLEIVKLMNANAIERVRTAAMHTFADSFVFGRPKKDG